MILLRLLRLWRVYAYLDLMFMTRNLGSVIIYYLSDAVIFGAAITATLLLAARFEGIGAWTQPQIVFMLGYALLTDAVVNVFATYNVYFVSRRIGRGQFDHTLVQPLPIWLALLGEGFAPFSGSGALLPALGLIVWAGNRSGLTPTPAWFALLLLNLAASVVIMASFSFSWSSLAFWAPRGAEEISSNTNRIMTQLKPFPLDSVSALLVGGLLTVIPTGFAVWFPVRALLGVGGDAVGPVPAVLVTPLVSLVFAALTIWIFRRGLHHYARTGSQRYLAWGFRR